MNKYKILNIGKSLLIAILAVTIFASCSKEDEPVSLPSDEMAAHIKSMVLDENGEILFDASTSVSGLYAKTAEDEESARKWCEELLLNKWDGNDRKVILSDNYGFIELKTNDLPDGVWFMVVFNVRDIPDFTLLLATSEYCENNNSSVKDITAITLEVLPWNYMEVSTQSNDKESYTTEFFAGDACGLYIVRGDKIIYENIKLTATNTADDYTIIWKPETSIANVSLGDNYFLYYPYQEDMRDKTNASAEDAERFFATLSEEWQPKMNQCYYSDYTASDLMTSKGIISDGTNGTLSLSFSMEHRMAMAVIKMPDTDYYFMDATGEKIHYLRGVSWAEFTDIEFQPCSIIPGSYCYLVNPKNDKAINISGSYGDDSMKFTVTLSQIAAGYCRTYNVDDADAIEIEHKPQVGDFYCSKEIDGKIIGYVVPQEAVAILDQHRCIGIVFYAGHNVDDQSDYSATGIGQRECHGYVVALTDAQNNGTSDRPCWEYGPNKEYDRVVGTSNYDLLPDKDWGGYYNSLKFHEFINNSSNKTSGWEMKHFPAVLACETYGNRTIDHNGDSANGKYDWQKPLAAPQNSSGWFMPSCGQLQYIYDYSWIISARITDIEGCTPNDSRYKDHIKWFREDYYYWSSTESKHYPSQQAIVVSFRSRFRGGFTKSLPHDVRAVLAF